MALMLVVALQVRAIFQALNQLKYYEVLAVHSSVVVSQVVTVNLITKRPQFEKGGEVRATFGRWDQRRYEGDFQTVAGDGENVGIRIVGFYEDAESFRDTVEIEKMGLYPSITWDVSDATSVTYELEYTDQEIPFDRGVLFAPGFGFSPRDTFTGEPGDGPIDTEVLGHQFEIQHNLSDNWSVLAGLGYRETEFEGNASETNFAGRQPYFLDGRSIGRFFRSRDFDSDYFVARAELAGQFEVGSVRHRIIIGADYDDFEYTFDIERFRGCRTKWHNRCERSRSGGLPTLGRIQSRVWSIPTTADWREHR